MQLGDCRGNRGKNEIMKNFWRFENDKFEYFIIVKKFLFAMC